MSFRPIRALLLLYGIANAILYSSLLPLWEGFDEEFHYGYVQFLGAHHRFPVLGPTGLSLEINRSIGLLPMSHVMIRNLHLHGVRTFDEYAALDSDTRHSLYSAAHAIPTELRSRESNEYYANYEVHHAPAAYLLLAIPDTLMRQISLPWRVWIDRLLGALVCVLLTAEGTWALASCAGLRPGFAAVLLFLLFSCQMFWATIAHVANDWLSVPLAIWLVVWALRFHSCPSRRNAVWLGFVLGLGLLSKAYFLVFVPLFLVLLLTWWRNRVLTPRTLAALVLIPAAISLPWYARNLILYRNLSGRIEESNGVTVGAALKSLASIPWLKSLPFMLRGTFWMGNSSFTDFSVATMNAVIFLLALALLLYAYPGRRTVRATDLFLWAPVMLFSAAMIYVTGSSYVFTGGEAKAASPWYLQAVLPLFLCIAMLGFQRAGRLGRWLAAVSALLWGYILAATYVAKLLPLYGGFSGGRSTLREILHWYLSDWPRIADVLSTTALVSASWLLTLVIILLAILIPAAGIVIMSLLYEHDTP